MLFKHTFLGECLWYTKEIARSLLAMVGVISLLCLVLLIFFILLLMIKFLIW